jgi:hypothetical protein
MGGRVTLMAVVPNHVLHTSACFQTLIHAQCLLLVGTTTAALGQQ